MLAAQELSDLLLTNNSAAVGGALLASACHGAVLQDLHTMYNTASARGGGAAVVQSQGLRMRGCLLQHNTVVEGAGGGAGLSVAGDVMTIPFSTPPPVSFCVLLCPSVSFCVLLSPSVSFCVLLCPSVASFALP